MNGNAQNIKNNIKKLSAVIITVILLSACAGKVPEGARAVRNKLTQLQSDSRLAPLAPVAIKEANDAVRAAEKPRTSSKEDQAAGHYLVFVADHKVDAARAQAERRLSEDQCHALQQQKCAP